MVTLENIVVTPEVSTLPKQVHRRKLTAGTLKSWRFGSDGFSFSIWMSVGTFTWQVGLCPKDPKAHAFFG